MTNCITKHYTCPDTLGEAIADADDIGKCRDEWIKEQNELVKMITYDTKIDPTKIKNIGGVDITFFKEDPTKAIVCLIVHDFQKVDPSSTYSTKNIVGKFTMECAICTPYIPFFLAYREVPGYLKLLEFVKTDYPELVPDVIIVDGCGVWHPRQCGSATHLGIKSGIPTIGVAKKFLQVDEMNRKDIEQLIRDKAPNKHDVVTARALDGRILGNVYNVTGSVKKVVYISVGHGVELTKATQIVQEMGTHRNNESIRQADLLSRKVVRKN